MLDDPTLAVIEIYDIDLLVINHIDSNGESKRREESGRETFDCEVALFCTSLISFGDSVLQAQESPSRSSKGYWPVETFPAFSHSQKPRGCEGTRQVSSDQR